MLAHYLKVAFTALRKYRLHAIVSLISLTLGFLCFIAANVLAGYLLSWDSHFPDSDRIFTVNVSGPNPRTDGVPLVPRHLGPYLQAEFPEIEHVATLGAGQYNVSSGNVTDVMRLRFIDGDYLSIFPLPVMASASGPETLAPNTALIMEAAALARFGTTDVVGRQLTIAQRVEVSIAGVVRKLNRPTHLQSVLGGVDLIVPMQLRDELSAWQRGETPREHWHDQSYGVYVKFASASAAQLAAYNQRLRQFSERTVPTRFYLSGPHQPVFTFRPLEENAPSHLKLVFGDVSVTALLTFAGFLVLFIAALNYSNMVIAQLTQRSQEITLQKVVGAKRRQLVAQYCLETLLVVGIALSIALAIAVIILLRSPTLILNGFHLGLLLTPVLWTTSLAGIAVIVAIAGAYPALRVTRQSLSSMLRPAGSSGYSHRLRSLMVGTQFAFSGALLILAIFVFKQNDTMILAVQDGDQDEILVLHGLLPETENELDLLEAELRSSAAIAATSRMHMVPWTLTNDTTALGHEPDPGAGWIALSRVIVGHDYFDTMQMPLLAGRQFSPDIASDLYPLPEELDSATGPYSVVIDEATAARLGWARPEEAVGKALYTTYMPPVVDQPMYLPLTVVGVVGNRHMEIATIGSQPTNVFMLSPAQANNLLVRPARGAVPDALAHIDRVWSRSYPGTPARPEFLDDIFGRTYAVFRRFGNVFAGLALFSFTISGVGLIGMATFITRLRQREVGIRKILGADTRRVLRMLLRDFSKPVLYANLIAWPIGFLLASAYLSIFHVRTSVTITPFVLSLSITLVVAVLAVMYQAQRSARLRPAVVLKQE